MLVFVSYARRDLGLARLVQRELDEQGIATWLDVSELRPGSDWSDEISDALRSSDALVLVASQTSLGSVHCAHEWRSALANAARVVLAVVEPVTLPEELRAQPAVDLRRVGRPRWEELADALRHGTAAPAHATPSIDRLRLPTPFRIAGLALALLLAFQVALVADVGRRALDLLAEGPSAAAAALVIGHVAILVLWIAFTTRWSWRFLRRDGTTNALLGMLAVPVLWILHAVFAGPDAGVFGIFVSLGLFALVMPAAGVELQAWAPATRHRRRRGSAGEAVDEALADDSRPSPPAPDRPAVSYALHFAPQDELVAERINDVMSRRELRPAGPGEPADVHLLVLSNATDAALAAQATRAAHGARTICLVITTIAVPDDLGVFHRHQWLDLRRAGGEELDRLTAWLRDPSTAQPRASRLTPSDSRASCSPLMRTSSSVSSSWWRRSSASPSCSPRCRPPTTRPPTSPAPRSWCRRSAARHWRRPPRRRCASAR
jgi:hypothetical protein